MSTAIIIIVLIGICFYAIQSYRKKLTSGCCGSGDAPEKKVKVADKNKAHYSYEAILRVDGMTCGNCVRRVENALNRLDGVWARVNLDKKQATVLVKLPDMQFELEDAVRRVGYGAAVIAWREQ